MALALAILVLWDLLLPGYVMSLDMVFGPNNPSIDYVLNPNPGTPFGFVLSLLTRTFHPMLIQKFLLFFLLAGSFLGMYFLSRQYTGGKNVYLWGAYYSALLYTINPFTYARFMAGHIQNLLAYSILPLMVLVAMRYVKNPSPRGMIHVLIMWSIMHSLDNPTFALATLALFLIFLLSATSKSTRSRKLLYTPLLPLMLVALNAFWILPASFNLTSATSQLYQVNYGDVQIFISRIWGAGPNILFSVASMHGFWLPYNYITNYVPAWQVLFGIILFLSILGLLLKSLRNEEHILKYSLLILAVTSAVFATGVSLPWFAPVFQFFFDNVVFFRVFREPHKFVALLALAYSYLGGIGVNNVALRIGQGNSHRKGKLLVLLPLILLLITPILYGSNMFFAFNRELRPVDYPREWYYANELVNQDPHDNKILFLPWHLYMPFSWVGRNIANPSSVFFTKEVIHGQNIEVGPIYSQSTDPKQRYVEILLANKEEIANFGELVAPLNVKYIVLAKEADYASYSFLYKQVDLKVIYNGTSIVVFQNLYRTSKFYLVHQIIEISSVKDVIEITKRTGILDFVFFVKEKNESRTIGGLQGNFEPLSYMREGIANFRILNATKSSGYIVFSESYSDQWVLNGRSAFPNLATTSAYPLEVRTKENIVYLQRMDTLLVGYLVSAISLVLITGFYFKERIIKASAKLRDLTIRRYLSQQ